MMSLVFLVLVAALAMLAVGLTLWSSRQRGSSLTTGHPADDYSIDISALAAVGPSEGPPCAAFYGVPVRLAVLVVAPVGRDGQLPGAEEMARLMEQWLPGVSLVIARDRPVFRRWPGQLSAQGFQHAFFHNLSLPQDRGKNTPWCSACGPFRAEQQRYLVGVVCCAALANAFSEVAVEHEGQWLDVFRIRLN